MPMMRPKPGIEFGIPDPPKAKAGDPEFDPSYHPYPKVLYKNEVDSETGAPFQTITVAGLLEHQALDEGWVETPAGFALPKKVNRVKVTA